MASVNGGVDDGVGRTPVEVFPGLGELSKKRKSTGANEGQEVVLPDAQPGPSKKAKLDEAENEPVPGQSPGIPSDRSALPVEIWLHIFSFCPPRTLGNLLCVNKLFNACLDPSSRVAAKKPLPALSSSAVKTMTPQLIWQNARRSFWPNMPGPLEDKSEIDMWRLSCSSTCQFCGRRDTRPTLSATDPLRFGPGSDGVAPIWAFRVRCCGDCLLRRSMKEIEFLLSEGSSFLMPALQFIFVTPDPCLIPLSIIDRVQLPSVSLSKLFWTADVEGLRQEFASVKELGAPAVEEWQKGLSTRGAEQRANIAKWEKYAESGGVANMRTLLYPGYRPQPSLPVARTEPDAARANNLPVAKPEPPKGKPQPAQTEKTNHTTHAAAKNVVPKPPDSEKSSRQTELAAPNLPSHPAGDARRQATNTNDTREAIDAAWDEIQGPVRLKILKYADEAIIGDWDDGEKVTKQNAPSFAADVLLHVRNRFYRQVEKDAADALANGRQPIVDPPQGPFTQKLTLENMKYVFDVKVKPVTDKLRKELFLCHACDYNSKFFGFEGVVQHYASKHTSALSVGNVVVYWRAEWPEISPFKPNPRPPKNKPSRPAPAIPYRPENTASSKPPPENRRPNNGRVSPGPPKLPLGQQFQAPLSKPAYPTIGPSQHSLHGSSYSQANSFDFGRLPTTQPQNFQQQPQPLPHSAPPLLPVAGRIQSSSAAAVPGHHDIHHNGVASSVSINPGAPPRVTHAVKMDQMAKWALTFWRSVAKANHLPVSLRLYLVIYHVDKKFRSTFQEPLPLSLFIDGLARHKDMRPLRDINALFCKACQLGLGTGAASVGKSAEFTMPQLGNHFQSTHAKKKTKPSDPPPLDWITDMLFLPQQHLLRHMLSPGDTWFAQLREAINHLVRRPERKQTQETQASQQKAAAAPDDSYSPQYNVASLSLPETSVSSGSQTKQNSAIHGSRGTAATMERQHSSQDQSRNAYQTNQNGHGTQPQQWEFSGFQIKGRGAAQEQKSAEESERQQEEAIREMWAVDRVQTAQVQASTSAPPVVKPALAIDRGLVQSESSNQENQRKTEHAPRDGFQPNKARLPTEKVSVKEEDRSPPGMRGIPTFSKKVVLPAAEEPDMLDALETHLNETQERDVPEARETTAMQRPTAGPAVYVDEHGREEVVQHEPYLHQAVPYEDERRARYVVDTRRPEAEYPRERPPSPARQVLHPRLATMEYDANVRRGSLSLAEGRRYVAGGEPPYETRAVVDGELPDRYVGARTRPVRYREYAYDPGYDHAGYGEDMRRVRPPVERPVEYAMYQPYEVVEDYEVVRMHHPDGDYYVRRPIRRERAYAGAVGEQHAAGRERYYYSEVPTPAPAPWLPMAAVPAPYEADGRMAERRREYGSVLAPPAVGYDTDMSGRGRYRAAAVMDGRGEADVDMGGYHEEEYDPRQPAAQGPGEGRWPMRYQ